MQYREFIERVQNLGKIQSQREAEIIVEKCLATFGERISSTSIDKLRSQLPNELKKNLIEQPFSSHFRLEEFYNRVSARTGLGYPDAVKFAKIVMSVVKQTVTDGLLKQILITIPPEFHELFE